jgi:putative selenium metabolism hydrolase
MAMDYEKIKQTVGAYEPAMTELLRQLIALPGDSGQEQARAQRVLTEMQALDFDECVIDPMGNVIGVMGQGERLIAFDGHMDTVGIGAPDAWSFDARQGRETESTVGGRGAADQLGGLVSALYGVKVMKELGLIPNGYRVMVTATVQEEECDGLCWQYLHDQSHITPEFVVLTEPTDGGIYRGHRGRMEISVQVKGTTCHGSAPERGDNAIYKMAEILRDIQALNDNPADHETIPGLAQMLEDAQNLQSDDAQFLGQGTVTVTEISSTSPAHCAVADGCCAILDRRLTAGETVESALAQLRELPACQKYADDVTISIPPYDKPSWTGLVYPGECCCPTWIAPETAPHVQAVVQAHEALFGPSRQGTVDALETRQDRPLVDKWTFSTNGAAICGRYGIPCVGFGPGAEDQAHAPDEMTWKQDMAVCAAVYAAVPTLYAKATGTAITPVKEATGFFKKIFKK